MHKDFGIIGGGIAGLTLAVALQQKGFNVTVYEQAADIKPLGAGLALASNAVKAFQEIGISEQILKEGKVIRTLKILSASGNVLNETDAEHFTRKFNTVNNFTIHRADLHRVLLANLQAGTLITGKQCIDVIDSDEGVRLIFSDGTSAHHQFVIASDGVHSPVRQKLIPESEPRYAGYTCWRAVIEMPSEVDCEETTETWGAGKRFGIVPLSGNKLYWFACVNAQRDSASMKSMRVADLLMLFSSFHKPIPHVIRSTKNEELIWGDIVDIKPLTRFCFGNILLLGDAAHATTPNMGQGACMAIEDAVVLRNCLVREPDTKKAFKTFEEKRKGRTKKIVATSWRLGKVAQVENSVLIAIRNVLLKATPKSVTEKQLKFISDVSFD